MENFSVKQSHIGCLYQILNKIINMSTFEYMNTRIREMSLIQLKALLRQYSDHKNREELQIKIMVENEIEIREIEKVNQ